MEQAREVHPVAFQQVLDRVKPLRDQNERKSIRELWWRFAWERPVLRRAINGLSRYFVTLETAKHRFFVAVDGNCLWDGSLFAVACNDYFVFGVLSSKIHTLWSLAAGGTLENRPRYNNSRCFDPFPFPDCAAAQQAQIRALGEQLDAHRKRQQALHPDLTLTEMYNVLEKLRAAEPLTEKERATHKRGLVAVLRQLHDELDAAVAAAYGWPATLSDEEILQRLVELNAARAREEQTGLIRWLRPEYQKPAGVQTALDTGEADATATITTAAKPVKLAWPKTLPEQASALRAALSAQTGVVTAEQLAKTFTRARTDAVENLLQTLVSLGLAREVEARKFAV